MKSTSQFKHNKRGLECLNCMQPLSDKDNFCSNCGQVNDELPLSIKQFISEFFAGFFSFDTRFFKTFFPIIFKPGKVSREYIEGKRRKYVNPFQLYLHVTIVFFLIQGLFSALDEYKVSGSFLKKNEVNVETDSLLKMGSIIAKEVQDDLADQGITIDIPMNISADSIKQARKDSILKKYNLPFVKESKKDSILNIAFEKTKDHLDSIFENTTIIEQLKNDSLSIAQKDSIFDIFYNSNMVFITKILNAESVENWKGIHNISKLTELSTNYIEEVFKSKEVNFVLLDKYKTSFEDKMILNIVGKTVFKKISNFMAYDNNNHKISVLQALDDLGYPKTRWNIFYYKKAQDFNKFKKDADFRNSYLDDVISKISIALFFMLPLFTLFLSLIYIRGKRSYTEHLVLVFNVQTVFFILLIFFIFFNRIFKTDAGIGLFNLVFLFYLYKSLRNFYKQNRFKTIVKFLMLNSIYLILSSIGFIIISFIAFVF